MLLNNEMKALLLRFKYTKKIVLFLRFTGLRSIILPDYAMSIV